MLWCPFKQSRDRMKALDNKSKVLDCKFRLTGGKFPALLGSCVVWRGCVSISSS